MAFSHYTDVTIQSSKIDSDQTDLVITINGSDLSTDFFSTAKSDGGDIRAYDVTETTEYPIHIAFYDNVAETARIYVRNSGTTSSSSNTVIRLMYGDAALSLYARDATYGAEAVWANAVFAAPLADGTSDYVDYSDSNLPQNYTSGTIVSVLSPFDGNGIDLDANEYLGWSSNAAVRKANEFTWTLWTKNYTDPYGTGAVFNLGGASNPPYSVTIQRLQSTNAYRAVIYSGNTTYALATGATAYTDPTDWLFLGHSYGVSAGIDIWVNGAIDGSGSYNGTVDYTSDGNDDPLLNYWKSYYTCDASYTELVMWDEVLNADFMLALYRNQDTATFYTIGTHTATSSPSSSAPIVVVLL